tara:strand:- start:502 stop:2157 length:1656 start_codon:yes stop_codon:yes gene_type:complete
MLNNEPKVFLSLTTSPTRVDKIVEMLNDLNLDHFDKVMINIPLRFGRTNTLYTIPKKLQKYPKVQINRFDVDFGPLSKILPTLQISKNPNDIIVSIDDDIKHDNNIFPLLIQYCRTRDVVVTGFGKNLSYWASKKYGNMPRVTPFEYPATGSYVDLIEGFSGVAYKRKFFPDLNLLVTLSKITKDCYLSDDLVISFYLKLWGRRILSLMRMKKYGWGFENSKYTLKLYDWGLQNNALHKGGGLSFQEANIDVNKIKYPKCYAKLRDFFKSKKISINKLLLKHWHHDYDRIYIINMKSKPERKAQSLKILKTLAVPNHKIKVITATTPNRGPKVLVKELQKLGLNGSSLRNYIGHRRYSDLKWHGMRKDTHRESKIMYHKILVELAVSISQLRAIKKGMDKNETILMLEDDFGPTSHFYNPNTHKLQREITWETLYLGDCSTMRSGRSKLLIKGMYNSLIASRTVCHHSLAFKPSMGRRLLKKKPITPFDVAINDELAYYLDEHKIPFAIFNKPLMIQDVELGTKSDIQEANKVAWEISNSDKFGTLNLRKL